MSDEVTLYEANPSMFRNAPVLFVLSCLLCVVGVGAVILLVWWLKCKGTTLIVTNEGVTLKKGILSKSMNELWH